MFKMSSEFMLSMKMLSSYTKRNALTNFGKKYSISSLLIGPSLDTVYAALSKVVKSGLILAQTNAESERSLTSERKFYDPENLRPEKNCPDRWSSNCCAICAHAS